MLRIQIGRAQTAARESRRNGPSFQKTKSSATNPSPCGVAAWAETAAGASRGCRSGYACLRLGHCAIANSRVHQLRRRLHIRHPLEEAQCRARRRGQLRARGAPGQMLVELGLSRPPSASRPVNRTGRSQIRARHNADLCLRSSRASSARPRFSRDFTVPSGIFNTSAISRYSSSCRSRKTTVSRNSGDNLPAPPATTRWPRGLPARDPAAPMPARHIPSAPASEVDLRSARLRDPAWYGDSCRSEGFGPTALTR